MNVEKLVSKKTMSLMIAIVLLLAGILFCISPAIGESSVGIVLGIGVLLVGVILAVKDFLVNKSLLTRGVIIGSVVAALGIYFMANGGIVSSIIGVIPYIFIVTGACIVADAILLKTVRDKTNDKKFAIELSVGIVAIVLGILILTVPFFRKALAVVIGVCLIGFSVYFLIGMFKKEKGEKKPAKAEKTEKKEEPAAAAAPAKKSTAKKAK